MTHRAQRLPRSRPIAQLTQSMACEQIAAPHTFSLNGQET
jgi:hypothetical protein